MGTEYKVTVNYSKPISKQSEAQAFIFKNDEDGLRWEVHIPQEMPTSQINKYFGQETMHLTPIRVYTMYVRVITHLPFS